MGKSKENMLNLNKDDKNLKDVLIRYRLFFIAALLFVLGGLLFKMGVLYSCQDGYLQDNICVQPKEVGMIKVCETEPYTCIETCENFQIQEKQLFCSDYCAECPVCSLER